MDEQLTIRIPREIAQALARRAKTRRVKRSLLVREALAQYLAEPDEGDARAVWERAKRYVGSTPLDHDAIRADPVASRIYEQNWRP